MKNRIKIMEVCGTHTVSIFRAGIRELLPENVEVVSGPGCPVCVTSVSDIDKAIWFSKKDNAIITTYGDMYKIPGSISSLENEKTKGADVRVIVSTQDIIKIAKDNSEKEIVFISIGFETTTPAVAYLVEELKRNKIKNVSILALNKTIPEVMKLLLGDSKTKIDGFILPGHVAVITGSDIFNFISRKYEKSGVISGFSPEEILSSIKILVRLIENDKKEIVNNYTQVVLGKGNDKARKMIEKYFKKSTADWRGFGRIKNSGLSLRESFAELEAGIKFKIPKMRSKENPACLCGQIIQGIKNPSQCKLFRKACVPSKPIGPCMVSSEGTCAAYYKYGAKNV